MNSQQMRAELIKKYPGDKWKTKVQKMSDSQVVAIYLSMQGRKAV